MGEVPQPGRTLSLHATWWCLPGGLKKDVVTCNDAGAVKTWSETPRSSGFAATDELAPCLGPLEGHGRQLFAAQCYEPQQLHTDGLGLAVSWRHLLKALGT